MFLTLQRIEEILSARLRPGARIAGGLARSTALHRARAVAGPRAARSIAMADPADKTASRQIEWLATVAHELRSPLAPIRTASALITIGGPEERRRAQAIIERQVAHMSRTIDDLLDLSRSGTGKLRLELDTLDISEVVDRAVGACQPAMARRRQHLEIRGPDARCALRADVVRLTQILSNLLDNASKYSPDGQAISLTVRRVDRSVELIVADNGIGIDPSALERVFLPFAQDPRAIGFNASGLGLGLAVVRELVTAHGGHVIASSDGIGCGSRFVVTLPCAPLPSGIPA